MSEKFLEFVHLLKMKIVPKEEKSKYSGKPFPE